jgi:hypothetical protein
MLGEEFGVDCVAISLLEANEGSEGNEEGEKDELHNLDLPSALSESDPEVWRQFLAAAPIHLDLEHLQQHPHSIK